MSTSSSSKSAPSDLPSSDPKPIELQIATRRYSVAWCLFGIVCGLACSSAPTEEAPNGLDAITLAPETSEPASPAQSSSNPAPAPSVSASNPTSDPTEPTSNSTVPNSVDSGPTPSVTPPNSDTVPPSSITEPNPTTPIEPAPAPVADPARPAGWAAETHERRDPNYQTVFPEVEVQTLTIRIAPEHWTEMIDFMTEHWGSRSQGGSFGGGGGGFGGGGFGGGDDGSLRFVEESPVWVPADLELHGVTWPKVGIRFKGNSSLRTAWSSSTDRLPFRINTDKFEDDYPEIKNQRFHGFKKLSLNTNWNDATFGMRERITYQLFREAGLVVSEAASYQVLLDRGEGPTNLGIYTLVEIIDDTVVAHHFGSSDGNIYKPDGGAANLAASLFSGISEGFVKQNNEDAGDWSDVERLHQALHSSLRTTDPVAWRTGLEATFDVDSFLRFLALAALVEHGDTYGAMAHNYYFYSDPTDRRMHFISWDHDLTFGAGNFFQAPFSKANVSATDWPLIRFTWDDATYRSRYFEHLRDIRDNVFDPAACEARYREWEPQFRSRITGATATFDSAVTSLVSATNGRLTALNNFLTQQQ